MSRIGNGQHRRDHIAIGLSPDIGNTVLRYDDVAQMPRDRLMAV